MYDFVVNEFVEGGFVNALVEVVLVEEVFVVVDVLVEVVFEISFVVGSPEDPGIRG